MLMMFAKNLYSSKVVDNLRILLVSKFHAHGPFGLRVTAV
jgi:hypothetical protein